MSTDFDSFSNRGEYLSAHYFAEQLADGLKKGVFAAWADRESDENDSRPTPRVALRGLRSVYLDEKYRGFFAEQAKADAEDDEYPGNEDFEKRWNTYRDQEWCERVADWHRKVLVALGYPEGDVASGPRELTVHRAGRDHTVQVACHGDGIVAVDCGWSASNDTALDADAYGCLLHPVRVSAGETYESGHTLATWLFQSELGSEGGGPPRFVLLLCGGVIVLADRHAWGEGRYLAANLDAALERYDRKQYGELATIAGLFSHDALAPAEDGKGPAIDALVKASRDNAVGVSGELRQGLQKSVEIIANEVLDRLKQTGLDPRDLETPGEPFARQLTREALRYLYRVLFLLYAEARPELGILPADDGTYEAGYSVARLRDLVERDAQLTDETARNGFHLHASLDVLFNKVNHGHRPYGTEEWDERPGDDAETRKTKAKRRSEGRGLRFEPLRSELFEPASVKLIGRGIRDPRRDDDHPDGPAWLDLRLRNSALHEVLRLLTMKKAKRRGERGGFISYRNLGINQLGAVYEGLMSYTGIIADKELCEVAKGGDPEKGSWLVASHRLKEYPENTWVEYDERDREEKGLRGRKKYQPGEFVYRLAGRDRETSASYYTPESLTQVTVELALKHRLDQEKDDAGNVIKTRASELLQYRICEPALGSGAFLNEAINQVAEEYLRRRQDELGASIPTAEALTEKQKVKAYIALHNAYGVDLNSTGVELAEVSLWLNTMHPGMRAPWFGLHLRRGNSLIGGRRAVYAAEDVAPQKGMPGWLKGNRAQAPTRLPFRDNEAGGSWQPLPDGAVHQFLLPTSGWAAVTGASGDAKKLLTQLAENDVEQLKVWKKGFLKRPERKYTKAGTPRIDRKTGDEAASQYTRLRDAAQRAELLWKLVVKRMELSEREIARSIDVWGADSEKDGEFAFLRPAESSEEKDGAARLSKEKVYADLFNAVDTPYWRLKQVMNAWCALWFWPADQVGLLDGSDAEYAAESVDVEELLGGVGEPDTPMASARRPLPTNEPVPPTSKPLPRFVEAGLLFQMAGDQPSLDDASMDAEGDYFYEMQKAGGVPNQRRKPSTPTPKRRRPVIPLEDLNDWLDFLESMLGTGPVPDDSIGSTLDSLEELKDYEALLLDEMWMDQLDPKIRYPWMRVVEGIAEEQGFLHWELDFALVFAVGGGFDLQVGNPPWVQPQWKENSVIAEFEPWFMLNEKPLASEKQRRRAAELADADVTAYVLGEVTVTATLADYLAAPQAYPLIAGSQPDLYRAFMCQVWEHTAAFGSAGLVHPDTHFNGDKEAALREAAYRRLLVHADFVNAGNRFFPPPIGRSSHFGVHIYGTRGEIDFQHLSWLFSVEALRLSAVHDGRGDAPGVKFAGRWDERPHGKRVVRVTTDTLARWQRLSGEQNVPVEQARLLTPVSTAEGPAIDALAGYPLRLGALSPHIGNGFHESGAKKSVHGPNGDMSLIDYNKNLEGTEDYQADTWEDVVFKGPQIGVANPFFKQPSQGGGDVWGLNHEELPSDAIPESEYRRIADEETYHKAQEAWLDHVRLRQLLASEDEVSTARRWLAQELNCAVGEVSDEAVEQNLVSAATKSYTRFYRTAWRRMIAPDTERALYAAIIPPGPSHVNVVNSLAMRDMRETVLVAGFWSSLPTDYYLKITGRGDLLGRSARAMPAPHAQHPLAPALLLRSLRLNCLTTAYADLWEELHDPKWAGYEPWARPWTLMSTQLHEATPNWQRGTPLRTEYSRRAALVEIDALVAVWLGIDADTLITMYRARFPIMQDFDRVTWFDAAERKIAGDRYTYGHGQDKDHWKQFEKYRADPAFKAHQADPASNPAPETPVPDGYTAPFYKANRETEMREAHAYFQKRLDAAVAAGEWDPVKQEVPKS
ncbi:hypothetical protein RM572_05900 [Streptomyces sp. DSM 42041]|uniref:site-specific DNA-methyltransferase (adenine-specific) n=1 Tax=Streptomyces hazeniae TaxID=3075538 RepID=A0ABU2NMV1_9ACTN|nr:hypothetical protein [Streptomyces sp. DSM 42041]MDT0378312.1 hypothetical protein [Streptomyces sp. DSM 42041]